MLLIFLIDPKAKFSTVKRGFNAVYSLAIYKKASFVLIIEKHSSCFCFEIFANFSGDGALHSKY